MEYLYTKNAGTQTVTSYSHSFCFLCQKDFKNRHGLQIHKSKKHTNRSHVQIEQINQLNLP